MRVRNHFGAGGVCLRGGHHSLAEPIRQIVDVVRENNADDGKGIDCNKIGQIIRHSFLRSAFR